ncbi:MFS general substrate transporter [Dentipellis sp. KUC8613]|nr:MFS general substrate transporter [Dentipellis sp. KUC8613]
MPCDKLEGRSRTLPINDKMSTNDDKEKAATTEVHVVLDIEHAFVEDDPRKWSPFRKGISLFIISSACMIGGLSANIYNPAIGQIEDQLHATSAEISLSLSLFILLQGGVPIIWSSFSEILGRKIVYITSITLSIVGCIVAAEARSVGVLIGMRCLQAVGSSAVMAIGAATLADIYDPSERGTMMGIYYAAPLLGPSVGPILGGLLTQYLSWRATFWFLVIFMGCILVMFVGFFRDTFRRERSLVYQTSLRRNREQREREMLASKRSSGTGVCQQAEKEAKQEVQSAVEPVEAPPESATPPIEDIRLSVADVNPFPPLLFVLRRWNNLAIFLSSGMLYGFTYCILYTCVFTLQNKYHYNYLKIGLVMLSFGVGSVAGSILGGRWSDRVLHRMKTLNGGHYYPEMRLESTKLAMPFFPLSAIAYGWFAEKHVHIAAVCVALFFAGFFSIWIYSITLAYVVDANTGRSSSAVATNSGCRGFMAFVFAEIAVPLQNSIGDGGLYSLWTGILIATQGLVLLVLYKGARWREKAEVREAKR